MIPILCLRKVRLRELRKPPRASQPALGRAGIQPQAFLASESGLLAVRRWGDGWGDGCGCRRAELSQRQGGLDEQFRRAAWGGVSGAARARPPGVSLRRPGWMPGRRALEGHGRTSQRGGEDGRVGPGKPQEGRLSVCQLLSHQPFAGAERTVSKNVVTRKSLPSLGLLVASDATGVSGLCVRVRVRACGAGIVGERLWGNGPNLHAPSSVQLCGH